MSKSTYKEIQTRQDLVEFLNALTAEINRITADAPMLQALRPEARKIWENKIGILAIIRENLRDQSNIDQNNDREANIYFSDEYPEHKLDDNFVKNNVMEAITMYQKKHPEVEAKKEIAKHRGFWSWLWSLISSDAAQTKSKDFLKTYGLFSEEITVENAESQKPTSGANPDAKT